MRMGKRVLSIALLLVCAPALAYDWSTNPGNGSPQNPYQISEPEHLIAIGPDPNLLDKHFILLKAIVLPQPQTAGPNSFNCPVIGNSDNPFTGTFNGMHHSIQGLYLEEYAVNDYVGLFGVVQSTGDNSGIISNLTLVGPMILSTSCGQSTGGLVGHLINGKINQCAVIKDAEQKGSVNYRGNYPYHSVMSELFLGGVIALNSGGQLIQSCSDIEVNMNDAENNVTNVGGLIGKNEGGTVEACYSRVALGRSGGYPNNSHTGGLIGYNDGTVMLSYTAVSEKNNAYAIGSLVGNDGVGSCFLCYADISGLTSCSDAGPEIKSTADMMKTATFRGWGDNVWVVDQGHNMPRLMWERTAGIPLVDVSPVFGGGSGSQEDPYQIRDANDLQSMAFYRDTLDKHFILSNDITLGNSLDPHGNFRSIATRGVPFSGTFDGNNKTISGLDFRSGRTFAGLFGAIVGTGASVRNLILDDVHIDSAHGSVGGLAGYAERATIENCIIHADWIEGIDHVGGLIGWMYSGTVENCLVTGQVNGSNMVGRLIGRSGQGGAALQQHGWNAWWGRDPLDNVVRIGNTECRTIVNGKFGAGGLVGVQSWGSIENCLSESFFLPNSIMLGGFAGVLLKTNVKNCYSYGTFNVPSVSVVSLVAGGFAGHLYDSTLTSCFYRESAHPHQNSYGAPLTEIQMKQKSSFTGFDFAGDPADGQKEVWRIGVDGLAYPQLNSQMARQGDLAFPNGVGLEDVAELGRCWLAQTEDCTQCDLFADGVIDLADLDIVLQKWLKTSLALTEHMISMSALETGPNPDASYFPLANTGRTSAAFTVEHSGRLTITPQSAVIQSGQVLPLAFDLDVTGLLPGIYQESYQITSSDACNTPLSGTVVFEVLNRFPVLTLDRTYTHAFLRETGPNPLPEAVTIFNSGNEDAIYTTRFPGGQPAWLIVPSSGVVPADQSSLLPLEIDLVSSGLQPGSYEQIIEIVCPEASSEPCSFRLEVDVIPVAEFPFLQLMNSQYWFFVSELEPNPQFAQVDLYNFGYVPVDYYIDYPGGKPDWLSLTPASGTVTCEMPSALLLSIDVTGSGLQPGLYEQTVNIYENASGIDPQTVTIYLQLDNFNP